MSHFVTGIIIPKDVFERGEIEIRKYISEKMKKYNENVEVEPYIKSYKSKSKEYLENKIQEYEEIINDSEFSKRSEENQERCLDKLNYHKNVSPEEFWEEICSSYDDDEFDSEGNIISTYNPNSKWDWYRIGGRWDGQYIDNYYKSSENGFNFGDEHTTIENNSQTVKEYKKRFNINPEEYSMFSYLDLEGNWLERGSMGWWGFVSEEKEQSSYTEEILKFLNKQKDEDYIINLDCHI